MAVSSDGERDANDPLVRTLRDHKPPVRFHGLQVLRFIAALSIVAYHTGAYGAGILGIPAGSGGLIDFLNEPILSAQRFGSFSPSPALSSLIPSKVPPPGGFSFFIAGFALFPGTGSPLLSCSVRDADLGLQPASRLDAVLHWVLVIAGGAPNRFVLSVEWSLVYEVQFYAILGLLSFGGKRLVLIGTSLWLAICMTRLFSQPWTRPPAIRAGAKSRFPSLMRTFFWESWHTISCADRARSCVPWFRWSHPHFS